MHEHSPYFVESAGADHLWERRSPRQADEHLLWHTIRWLAELPKGVRPVHLPVEFPRIANELSRLWPDSEALDFYFEDKECSSRPYRTGFSALLKEEFLAMHIYSLQHRPAAYEERSPHQASLLD